MTQLFRVYKLGRKKNPENKSQPQIDDGIIFDGSPASCFSAAPMSLRVSSEDPTPVIGYPYYAQSVKIGDGTLRTSTIRSYYKHDDSGEHPDKLVLSCGFPIEDNIHIPELKQGDYLLATRNSIYHLEAINDNN